MSGYELLYVVPTEKTNKGKNSACLVLRKGNQEPQKQYQSAESYMVNWQEELEEETKYKAEVTSLYQTKNGRRGKVYLMPNQQIFIPISILPGKGNSTGYVSLKDVTGISQGYNGNGMIRFLEGRISLQTHMAVDSLFDRVNKAKSTYCEGFKPADLVMELITEKEKVQCALSQPNGLGADILHVGKSLTLATLDFLRQVPIEKLPEVIGDLCRKMGRVDGYWRDKKMDWLRAYIYTMVGHTATKEDVKKALELADRPETIPQVNPTEIGRKYWPAFCEIQEESPEINSVDTFATRPLIFVTARCDTVREITASPIASTITEAQSVLQKSSKMATLMETALSQTRTASPVSSAVSAMMESALSQARFEFPASPVVSAVMESVQTAFHASSAVSAMMKSALGQTQTTFPASSALSAAMKAAQQQTRLVGQQMRIHRNMSALRAISQGFEK